jgi:uncharacterized damage-inducible protein DinB
MKEVERIADQLSRAFEGEAWHGPAVMEILDGITARDASARPFKSAHNIWEIVLHIAAWEKACLRRLHGDRAQLPSEEDWPAVPEASEQSWEESKKGLKQAYERLRHAISQLADAQLDQPIVEGLSTVYVTLHGVIQHSLYHAGQIAILKKAVSEGERA